MKLKKLATIGLSLLAVLGVATTTLPAQAAWEKDSTGWWYSQNGGYARNEWKSIGGMWYHFNDHGYMQTGWLYENGIWYYLARTGAMATGWQYIGGEWYHFKNNGKMSANEWIGNYYVGASGAMITGSWVEGFYVNGSGAWVPDRWVSGWNGWWYRYGDGSYPTGWAYINGAWYYFDASGWMKTGWVYTGGEWYYLSSSGAMAKNTWIGNYYVGNTGAMLRDTWIGNYYVDASGAWVPGKVKPVPENTNTGNTDNSGNTGNTDNTNNTGNTGNTDTTGNTGNTGETDHTGNTGETTPKPKRHTLNFYIYETDINQATLYTSETLGDGAFFTMFGVTGYAAWTNFDQTSRYLPGAFLEITHDYDFYAKKLPPVGNATTTPGSDVNTEDPKGTDETVTDDPKGTDETVTEDPKGNDETVTEDPKGTDETVTEDPKGTDETVTEDPKGTDETVTDDPKETDQTETQWVDHRVTDLNEIYIWTIHPHFGDYTATDKADATRFEQELTAQGKKFAESIPDEDGSILITYIDSIDYTYEIQSDPDSTWVLGLIDYQYNPQTGEKRPPLVPLNKQ